MVGTDSIPTSDGWSTGRPSLRTRHADAVRHVDEGVVETRRASVWERLGPFGQFLVGVVVAFGVGMAGVHGLEAFAAATVRVPTVHTLPDRVSICGRSYHRSEGGSLDLLPIDELRATGIEVVIVLPLRMQPCIPGPCNGGFDGMRGCAAVVFVKVEGDRYAAYDLLGGP
jgi:hypothetical protein